MSSSPAENTHQTGNPQQEAGRTASRSELLRHLATAGPEYLDGAASNPSLGPREALLLLRNRQASPRLLQGIAADRRLANSREIDLALAMHPRTPEAIGRSLVERLDWRGLAEIAVSGPLHPTLRRKAEELLELRLAGLTTGERIALARRASRRLIVRLSSTRDAPVLAALLDNPRLVEADAIQLATAPAAPIEGLAQLAAHHRWGGRRAVRLALARNERTPFPAALHILHQLDRDDLQRLATDERAPRLVRAGAARLEAGPEAPAAEGT